MNHSTKTWVMKFEKYYRAATLAAFLWLVGSPASAQLMDTAFTYQGQLKSGGQPANGDFDFEFYLYDSSIGGSALEWQQNFGETVTDGIFTVEINVGTVPFNGQPLWLETRLRPAGGGSFVVLPRQKIATTPYAIYSDQADDADKLDGEDSSAFLRKSGDTVNGDLTVNGIIHSTSGGIRFPDNSVQMTAAAGGAGDGHSLDAADGSPVDAVFVSNSGDVGIGTTTPGSKLSVLGSLAVGEGTSAVGNSAAFGQICNASGANALASGFNSTASGAHSTAMGLGPTASGIAATAIGDNTKATGHLSTALGSFTTAQSYGSLAIGRWNEATGSQTSWVETDPLFVIGNGSSASSRLNAVTVLKNGRVGINKTNPGVKLDVLGSIAWGSSGAQLSATSGASIELRGSGLTYLDFSNDISTDYDVRFILQGDDILEIAGGSVGIGTPNPQFLLHVNGSAGKPGGGFWSTPSDQRLKNIDRPFRRGLEELNKLVPVYYHYKEENKLRLPSEEQYVGLVAQEVSEVIPEAVDSKNDGYLRITNDAILWTMVNAIKELKIQNDALRVLVCRDHPSDIGCR